MAEVHLLATLGERFGWDQAQVNKTDARLVLPLYKEAMKLRAIWIMDVQMAVWGGDALPKRIAALIDRDEAATEQNYDEQIELAKKITATMKPEDAEAALKRIQFLEQCRRLGWKPE